MGAQVPKFDRRGVLRLIGAAGVIGFGLIRVPAEAAPPKETGLSFEGLLKHEPGFQPRKIARLAYDEIPGFLSKAQLARNYAIYRAAFTELSEVEKTLATAPREDQYSAAYATLRQLQIVAANAVLLHEFYFRNLTARPAPPSRYVVANINEHMGSIDDWRGDFAAVMRVAEEWAALVYDPYDDRWHNVALGAANAGGWVGANPLIVCDVADHAWSIDYKDRATYSARFLDHVDWAMVADRYHKVDRQ
jgi:Fe-Mn family superoxide dismutase